MLYHECCFSTLLRQDVFLKTCFLHPDALSTIFTNKNCCGLTVLQISFSQQLKASLKQPHPWCMVMYEEVSMYVLINLLTACVIQSLYSCLTLFDKQMHGGFIKHVCKNTAVCLKLVLPA